jgi:hypothetical protein
MHLENISPFETKLVQIVGNLAQLPPIYKHTIRTMTYDAKVATSNLHHVGNNKTTFLIHFHASWYKF